MIIKPRLNQFALYTNNCPNCTYLITDGKYDVYWCTDSSSDFHKLYHSGECILVYNGDYFLYCTLKQAKQDIQEGRIERDGEAHGAALKGAKIWLEKTI